MDRIRLKEDAKADIRGRIFYAFQPFAILFLIEYGIGIFSTLSQRAYNPKVSTAFAVIYGILSFIYGLFSFPLTVGVASFYVDMVNGYQPQWSVVFDSLRDAKVFFKRFFAGILYALIVIAGLICLIIPGIHFALRLSQIQYVLAENPNISVKSAIKRSWDIMRGHTIEYFVLILSFFGWFLLMAITLGIAGIYVRPYVQCATARYYLSLCNNYNCEMQTSDNGFDPFSN